MKPRTESIAGAVLAIVIGIAFAVWLAHFAACEADMCAVIPLVRRAKRDVRNESEAAVELAQMPAPLPRIAPAPVRVRSPRWRRLLRAGWRFLSAPSPWK